MKQIPNLFTLLNLVFGCLAIIFILQVGQSIVYIDREGYSTWDLPEKLTWGSICIFAAALVDFLDGFVARMFKATSPMGKQLDSLADVVSFGVAPGMILYQLLRLSFAREEGGLDTSMVWMVPALLIPCAAAWRLAKFNIDETQQNSFKGLPTPAVGVTIASLPLIIFYQQMNLNDLLLNEWVLYGIILLLSFLMVSNLPMLSLKVKNLRLKENAGLYLLAAIAIASAALLKWVAVPVVLLAYVLVSLIFKNRKG
jgi:CDP-diacylglycerol---serine O-phosphatidyltransferase